LAGRATSRRAFFETGRGGRKLVESENRKKGLHPVSRRKTSHGEIPSSEGRQVLERKTSLACEELHSLRGGARKKKPTRGGEVAKKTERLLDGGVDQRDAALNGTIWYG